ncbi:TIGR02186 family protein [Notoacmeibacter sp. MSK16QG-6]|uniref:TIGR02186 family protein n=1 Tax=Notoacmeibacter sp. MSK16QG-6 TaxID=2957982 RepID=UPI0020A21065|nr:TIGR02186 family protein [Notoacmeibacter sp. MSK16QG-6]MCP1198633.1 TIGR02186 family protein [Notoacmeibacter sp. MSK16QG-6]
MRLLAILILFILSGQALAQTKVPDAIGPQPQIQIGLSTDTIYITSDFTGAVLTVFGTVTQMSGSPESAESIYSIAVTLEGPRQTAVVRKKNRVFGIWVNTQSEELRNVPLSYSIATSSEMGGPAGETVLSDLGIGVDAIAAGTLQKDAEMKDFVEALRRQRIEGGLYTKNDDSVQFLSGPLFRARLSLPAEIPVGLHVVEAFMFANGRLVDRVSLPLRIAKSDWEQTISRTARNNSLIYGLLAVVLAVVTGWLGRLVFKRD